ncbi:DUF5008 domain-containing protein [Chitinophaga sp. RAB17]|uniref:DUF5008 domain-containing protein n=1 Tax=Chitinophaga sp. RAB17 TaxID=3233049 RepID=UPI003F93D58E
MNNNILVVLLVFFLVGAGACKKDTYVGKDPYGDAKEQLKVKLNTTMASPATGGYGDVIRFTGSGFLKYKDSIVMKFNGQPAIIKAISDTTLQVQVPELASSGMVTMNVGDQVFPGPLFTVNGLMQVDNTFASFVGANDGVYRILGLPDGTYIVAGAFSDYNNGGPRAGNSGIVAILADGTQDKSFKTEGSIKGIVNDVQLMKNGQLLLCGYFNVNGYTAGVVSNLALLTSKGALVSRTVNHINKDGEAVIDTVPTFKAAFDGAVSQLRVQSNGDVIVIGGFKYYLSKQYYPAGKDTVITDSVRVSGVVRLHADGSFDSTYNYDLAAHRGKELMNGYISNTYLQSDDKLIVCGSFTKSDATAVNNLFRMNTDGTLDPSFQIGSGPDGVINYISPMRNGKFLITGRFIKYNSQPRNKVAVINADGSLDAGFDTGTGTGPDGYLYRSMELGNGQILVTGDFQLYNGIKRYGCAILEPTGKLSTKYNNIGGFGFTQPFFTIPVIDGVNAEDGHSTILTGNFNKLDLKQNNRLVKITY